MNHSLRRQRAAIASPLQPAAIVQFRTSQSLYPEGVAFAEKAVIGMTQEALSSLQTLGAQLRAKLLELPEYRALTVIERTIQELAEIMNPSAARSLAAIERPVPAAAAPIDPPAAPPRLEAASLLAGGSQNRMAKAIADAIAAKSPSFNTPAAGAVHLAHTLNAAP